MMKVLIQHCVTLLYVSHAGIWVKNPDEAFSFQSSRAALQFCLQNNLVNVQVVLKFADSQYDLRLPLRERQIPADDLPPPIPPPNSPSASDRSEML
jgi:hypothetical protein